MQKNIIKSFAVYGLFGTKDVCINFDENIKILIGENGIGKTQVLNLFYYTLKRDFFKLNEYNFNKLELTFWGERKIEISKKNITDLVRKTFKDPMIRELIEEIGLEQFQTLRNKFVHGEMNPMQFEREIMLKPSNRNLRRHYSLGRIMRAFEDFERLEANSTNKFFDKCKNEIKEYLNDTDIMYFPTYRRVEEDLHNLGYAEEELSFNQENTLIQFGMDDVQKRFSKIENRIEDLLKKGLSVFLENILKIMIAKDKPSIDEGIFERINEEDLTIIFARAKDLDPDIKAAVLDSVKKRAFNDPLSGLILQKLVELYENQKEWDEAIISFKDTCNKYLVEKKVFYDESGIKIFIKSDLTDEKIELKHLSSGEKQIISMFSKIYLSEANQRFIVLFDEPELSLSMLWQKQLLPDIVNSKKCDFLLAVTHSPFIFNNELKGYAIGLNEYITYTNKALV